MQLLQSPSSQASPYPKVNKKKASRRPSKDEASTTDCAVCGDKASKYRYSHYGATSCFSCRAFFRRTVKKSKHEIFYCSSGNCQIDVVTRKKCPYCRYEISLIIKNAKSRHEHKGGTDPNRVFYLYHGTADMKAYKFVWFFSANHKCILSLVDQWECSNFVALNLSAFLSTVW